MSSIDWGIELLSPDEPPLAEELDAVLLSPELLIDDLPASLNAAEMAKRQFREIARVAGLVFPGLPRSGKTARQLQASSGLFFDVFQRYDPDNLLLAQAHREVLERQLERSRLGATLQRIAAARVVVTTPKRFTPLAFPLLVDRTRNKVSSEKLGDRIKRMQLALERAAGCARRSPSPARRSSCVPSAPHTGRAGACCSSPIRTSGRRPVSAPSVCTCRAAPPRTHWRGSMRLSRGSHQYGSSSSATSCTHAKGGAPRPSTHSPRGATGMSASRCDSCAAITTGAPVIRRAK
jgi:hypothetical protein